MGLISSILDGSLSEYAYITMISKFHYIAGGIEINIKTGKG